MDARIHPEDLAGTNTGVFVGSCNSDIYTASPIRESSNGAGWPGFKISEKYAILYKGCTYGVGGGGLKFNG